MTNEAQATTEEQEVDVTTLDKNDKYLAILSGVQQSGPFFFTTTKPEDLDLEENDPIYLSWVSLVANWKILCLILGQFEQVMTLQANANQGDTDESADEATPSE